MNKFVKENVIYLRQRKVWFYEFLVTVDFFISQWAIRAPKNALIIS